MGGACYNAVLSVNLDELDFIDNFNITSSMSVLSNTGNIADTVFGIGIDPTTGYVSLAHNKENNVNNLDKTISSEVQSNEEKIKAIKEKNKDTKLNDNELLDLYNNFNSNGFLIF